MRLFFCSTAPGLSPYRTMRSRTASPRPANPPMTPVLRIIDSNTGVPPLRGVLRQPPNFRIAAMTHVSSSPRMTHFRIWRVNLAVFISGLVSNAGVVTDMTFSLGMVGGRENIPVKQGGMFDDKN